MDGKAALIHRMQDTLAAALEGQGITVTTNAEIPVAPRGDIGGRVIDELERTIPGAHRDERGSLVLDGDAVSEAARSMGGGRRVDSETGEVRDPEREAYRRKYLVLGTDPDAPILMPEYGRVERPGGIPDYLRRAESALLSDIIDGLIERTGRYAPLADLQIACLWASDLGTVEGEPRLYRWKKPDDLTRWALGTGRPQRAYDLILEADGTVAARGQMTLWQAQALAHTAIDRVRVRSGRRIQVVPESALIQHFITARYGQWNAALMGIARALALAEREQLPLWDEAGEEEGEGDE